jgi:rhamnosyltransferase
LETSIIVRTKNQAHNVAEAIAALRAQTQPVEIVLVDSGSTDDTLTLARPLVDRLIELPAADYRPGLALNLGAAAASGEIVGALSAHCRPPDEGWVERSLALYAVSDVAGTNGTTHGPGRVPLESVFYQGTEHLGDVSWGFSNHASTWRASVWAQHPFDAAVPTAEDRIWATEVLRAGWRLAFDPSLDVAVSHRWKVGPVAYYRRIREENRVVQLAGPVPPFTAVDALRTWWSSIPLDHHSTAFHRTNPKRMAEMAGIWSGRRRAP